MSAFDAVHHTIRALASALQVFGLYPDGHPNRDDAGRTLHETARRLALATDQPLFITRSSLYLGPTLLARESLSHLRLVDAFTDAGIEAVEFTSDVAQKDLNQLIEMLLDQRPVSERVGGVVINRVAPATVIESDAQLTDLTELRRVYASGLQLLRETTSRILTGRAVDLEAATAVVEDLAEEVAADPANALMLTTVKSYDEYTYYHLLNVCLLSVALGQAVGLRRDQTVSLGIGGLLHDIGKVQMPEDVLKHVGKLNEEQWRLVQKHPVDGAGLVFGTHDGLYHPAATVVLEHHSAFDLSGYPPLSRRQRPSLPARMVSVVDCFDAVTSRRSYRSPVERRQALEILESGAGRGFDPTVVRVFITLLGLFPIGSVVRLDTEEVGIVVRNQQKLGRPVVRMVLDRHGNVADPEERDLALQDDDGQFRWKVVRTIDPQALGIDVMDVMTTGKVRLADPEPAQGLVHEPSYGESRPEGYVDTHALGHTHSHDLGQVDTDIHPPIE